MRASVGLGDDFIDTCEVLRVKLEVASTPKQETKEEEIERVDLYKGAFSLAYRSSERSPCFETRRCISNAAASTAFSARISGVRPA